MPAYEALELDHGTHAQRTFCSWTDTGWRSVLLQVHDDAPDAVEFSLPPIAEQHLVLATAGDAWLESHADGGWRSAHYTRGQIGLTAPGRSTRLRYRSTAGMTTLHLYLPGSLMQRVGLELWGGDRLASHQPDALAVTDPVAEQVILGLAAAASDGLDDLYAETAAEFLAVHLHTRYGGMPPAEIPRYEDARVRKAIELMRDNLQAPLTLSDIAGEIWLSVYHFLRVFKAATGQTPRRYLTSLRVQAARRHLADSDILISEVARLCGFSSPAQLSAVFIRETGVSPSAYRQSHRRT
ncbi:helix-turn-helix domain-containing protein [Kribbella sp. NPDC056345]|uniref:helix-turn-helix domain-containing protein n=1 Tax=Kribbella sp. NPDC056345 TaxID=3345789 RepID=UPI0035D9B347